MSLRILTINNYHYRRGGAEVCYLDFNEYLKKKKYLVPSFSMRMPQNIPSQWDRYFIDEIEYENLNAIGKLLSSVKIIYSIEAKKKLKKLLDHTKPEIVHLHNIYHHISPSILSLIKEYNLPTVMTLHDLKLLCPNYKMLNNGKVCELCKGGKFYNATVHKCLKGSLSLSILITIEMYVHRFLKVYENNIDLFISPSQFLKQKLVDYGFSEENIIYVPNFVQLSRYRPDFKSGDYILYVGRLSEEKGIHTLLNAMTSLKDIKLKIVGSGPEERKAETIIKKLKLNNVELIGHKGTDELGAIYRKAKFLILPSECYENAPINVLEAFACGKPVIGADIGGIPELVNNGENGLLFAPGQVRDLIDKISFLSSNPGIVKKLGINARDFVEKRFSPEKYYKKIFSIYKKLI